MTDQREGPAGEQRGPDNHCDRENFNSIVEINEQAQTQGSPDSSVPQSVDGALLLDELSASFCRHLSLPEGAADAMALWVVFTWCLDSFQHSPRLAFQSPVYGCGKTTAFEILKELVPNPLATSNITPPALYRTLQKESRTLLIDELDTQDTCKKSELLNVLNSGHNRATSTVCRCDGKNFEPREYPTWAAAALARIGPLEPALQDRSVIIQMHRAKPDEKLEELTLAVKANLGTFKQQIQAWAQKNMVALRSARPDMPAGFHNRLADNWRPLFAIAEAIGGEWPESARRAAKVLTGEIELSEPLRILCVCWNIVKSNAADRIASEDLFAALQACGEPDSSLEEVFLPSSKKKLAEYLKYFGIRPKKMRFSGKSLQGYERKDFEDVAARYLTHCTPVEDGDSAHADYAEQTEQ